MAYNDKTTAAKTAQHPQHPVQAVAVHPPNNAVLSKYDPNTKQTRSLKPIK